MGADKITFQKKPNIITVGLHKGGVGKSLTTVELAKHFSVLGYKVCVVDTDPQGNATKGLLGSAAADGNPTLTEILLLAGNETVLQSLLPLAIRHGKTADVLPASGELARKQSAIDDPALLQKLLRGPVFSEYDFILIDTPPSEGILMLSAYTAADYFLAVMAAGDPHSYDSGITGVFNLFRRVRQTLNPELKLLGAVLTRVGSSSMAKGSVDYMDRKYPNFALRTVIHERGGRAVEAWSSPEIDPKNTLEDEYGTLAGEVLEIIKDTEDEDDGEEEV